MRRTTFAIVMALAGCDESPGFRDEPEPPGLEPPGLAADMDPGDPYTYAASLANNTCDLNPSREPYYVGLDAMIMIRANGFSTVKADAWETDFDTMEVRYHVTDDDGLFAVMAMVEWTRTNQAPMAAYLGDPEWSWAMDVQAMRQEVMTMMHFGWRFGSIIDSMTAKIEERASSEGWNEETIEDTMGLVLDSWCE